MRFFIFLILQVLLFLPLTSLAADVGMAPTTPTHQNTEITAVQKAAVIKTYGNLPLYFIENKGQVDGQVGFYERGAGHATFFTSDGLILSLTKKESKAEKASFTEDILGLKTEESAKTTTEALSLSFVGANEKTKISSSHKMSGHVNYFVGNDKTKWRSNIPTYGAVTYKDVYKNIEVRFYGNNRQLEHDVIVRPGGDISKVRFAYKGAKGLKVTDDGDLEVSLKDGKIIEQNPVIYQEINGERVAVDGSYRIFKGNTYGFDVASYDHTKKIVIDPVLVYSTYLEGNSNDDANSIAVDSSGAAYVTGSTSSLDFPLVSPIQGVYGGGLEDAFITKINPAGTALVYSSYLGGSGDDFGVGIAVDNAGNAYVTGGTLSTDFPLASPMKGTLGGNGDAFITKINPAGSALVYSTYLGGGGDESAHGIAVDASENAYVTGNTLSTDFPVVNPIQGTLSGTMDTFATKINPAGTALVYSSYLGGSGDDYGVGIAVDNAGNAYVTGGTLSPDFPLVSPIQGTFGGNGDAFITKINPAGSALVYSTYLGGRLGDGAGGIAVDASGNAYVTGETKSPDFPLASPIQGTYGGGWLRGDSFVSKINPTGTAFVYSTYLGGNTFDSGNGIAVDSSGAAYVTGWTQSPDFPLASPIQGDYRGGGDAFITKINPAGSAFVYSTYLGGGGVDSGGGIAVDASENAYVTGSTDSLNFPLDIRDVFISKINDAGPPLVLTLTLTPDVASIALGSSLGYGVTITNTSATQQCFDYWENVTLPLGMIYPPSGDLFGWNNICLTAGATLSVHLTHGVPMTAPVGAYIFNAFVGTNPTPVTSEAHFNFDVTAFNPATLHPETSWRLLENGFRK